MDEITERILSHFREVSSIPRCSKNEEKIAMWLKQWALHHGFSVKFDSVNNIVIGVAGSKGCEYLPSIVVQGHMDMVCEKTQDIDHDFSKDYIVPVVDGEWLRAQGTTLGADNGIAIAIALALAEDKGLKHPPLELLFTVDEETGLTGANALTHDFISGEILLNVDSEDEGVFTVGCAGGLNTTITMPVDLSPLPENMITFNLVVNGLAGGHSGVDIHEGRANANKLIAGALNSIADRMDIRIVDIKGGSAHNAIPRYAQAIVAVLANKQEELSKLISDLESEMKSDYSEIETGLAIRIEGCSSPSFDLQKETMESIGPETSSRIIGLLQELPHGVASMSADIEGLVETSSNLATINIKDGKLVVISSQRSSVDSGLAALTSSIENIAKKYGADYEHNSGYPPWQPDMSSPLLKRCMEIYSSVFTKKAKIEVIHAGLECAVIGSKFENIDMISFGPTIKNPHSPDECLHIPSIRKIWDFMVVLLESFAVMDEKKKRGKAKKKGKGQSSRS
ncbi:aminoacyl-histidine dipeptidase [Methanolobus sediminis]|uniref:Aminoacyl-histidine dipeptidase n=1 Tax=Methanolobus sediminis TaxID=3072978 RepID=A0AA51UKN0_9EURY|nr:aminoacyl-histidine dipeptidase [Methanolobus sediminis]WMW25311.1 aminoacyl-histidine dipeptidase [Methanolobus sediminis]